MANLWLHASREARQVAALLKQQTRTQLRLLMNNCLANPVLLLETVGRGQFEWRRALLKNFPGLVDEAIANALYAYLAHAASKQFPGLTPSQALDALSPVSPPTDKEIDDAWVVESTSSEEGRRYFYGPDGHPEDLVRRMDRFTTDRRREY